MGSDEKDEQPETCLSCDKKTEALTQYKYGCGGWLCFICASTPAGNVALYPEVHRDADVDVLKTVVWAAHMILDTLKENRSP